MPIPRSTSRWLSPANFTTSSPRWAPRVAGPPPRRVRWVTLEHSQSRRRCAHRLRSRDPGRGDPRSGGRRRATSENISYFAFTATPKGKTLELFGREPGQGENSVSFRVYTMKQAIEEDCILDVLIHQPAWSVPPDLRYREVVLPSRRRGGGAGDRSRDRCGHRRAVSTRSSSSSRSRLSVVTDTGADMTDSMERSYDIARRANMFRVYREAGILQRLLNAAIVY